MTRNYEITFCPKCGSKQESNIFCSKCGNKLIDKEDNKKSHPLTEPNKIENLKKSNNQKEKPVGFFGDKKNKITRHSAFRWYMRKYRILTIIVMIIWNIGVLPIALVLLVVDGIAVLNVIIFVAFYYIWNDVIGKLICKSSMKKVKKQNPDYDFDMDVG